MHPSLGLSVVVLFLINYVPASTGAPSGVESRLALLADPHIINGVNTNIEKVPYQISLEHFRFHVCGGVIVSELWVVTAAHCIYPELSGELWPKRIRAGSTTEIPVIGWGGHIRQIAFAKYHDMFNTRALDYDVGVIRVTEKFKFTKKIQPVALPPTGEEFIDYTKNATISGYGLTKVKGLLPSLPSWHLKSAVVPLIPRSECQRKFASATKIQISKRMICGEGTGAAGSGTFKGDSGGPVVHKEKLIGLVSWGLRPTNANLPSVYTNVLDVEIRGFIKNNTGI